MLTVASLATHGAQTFLLQKTKQLQNFITPTKSWLTSDRRPALIIFSKKRCFQLVSALASTIHRMLASFCGLTNISGNVSELMNSLKRWFTNIDHNLLQLALQTD